MARILVVEDEPALARSLRMGLEDELHVVRVEHDGQEALFRALTGEFDLIVLDRMLPRFSGDDICRRLRLDGVVVPILMLTARDATSDVVAGLDAGADDYLTKPFSFEVLLARVRALLRRTVGQSSDERIVGPLRIDASRHLVWWHDREVVLTAKEFQILDALAARPGRVFSKAQLARAAWEGDPQDNVIEVHISHLRRKLAPDVIRTVRGVGYVLEEPR
jgi:DNA-binding response OmpR family regulator